MDNYIIEPLSYRTANEAIKLLQEIFPYEKSAEPPELYLRASLDIDKYKELLTTANIPHLSYWVALDIQSRRVIGNTGLYVYEFDKEIASWLGWTGVSERCRGQGLGKRLIEMMIENANRAGKRYMRIWTSTHPNEAIANSFYAKRGFVDFKDPEKITGTDYFRRHLQLTIDRL